MQRLRESAPAPEYRLRTVDDAAALTIADGSDEVAVQPYASGGLTVRAQVADLDGYVTELVGARIAVRELRQSISPLEQMFFTLTETDRSPNALPDTDIGDGTAAGRRRAGHGPMTGTAAETPGLVDGAVTSPRPARTPHGVATVYHWEMEKLAALLRVRLAAVACFLAPFGLVAALRLQDAVPADTLFGRWTHFSGFATPMVMLVFTGQWALPLLTCLVAGDIFASEDRYGTWKTILTRSCTRAGIFWGKSFAAMTFAVAIVVLLALGSLTAGVLVIGTQPLVSLSGTLIPPGQAAGLVLASWATAILPTLGFTAMGLLFSCATRNSPAGILGPSAVGLVMQLLTFVNGVDIVRHLLLTTPYGSWHGLMSAHHYYAPLLWGAAVCVVYLAGCLAAGYLLLRRRDIGDG